MSDYYTRPDPTNADGTLHFCTSAEEQIRNCPFDDRLRSIITLCHEQLARNAKEQADAKAEAEKRAAYDKELARVTAELRRKHGL